MLSVNELLKTHKYAAAGIAAAAVLTGWLCWYFSDRQVIKRQLIGLSWDVSKRSGQESTMETALKMREIKAALSASCRLIVPERHLDDSLERDLIIMYLSQYRSRCETVSVALDDIRIAFPAKGEAEVLSAVLMRKQEPQAAEKEVSAQVRLGLKKQDGSWLLTLAEIPAVLAE